MSDEALSAGDRVRDVWGNAGTVVDVDGAANHGLGRIVVKYDDGRELSFSTMGHPFSRIAASAPPAPEVVHGDLLDQPVEAIVNAWNRNVIPWWLLLPQGVSGAIKKRGGYAPFRELGRMGAIPLGGAVVTGSGRLPFKAIIHVAGIDLLWRSSERSVKGSVQSALALARERGFASVAFPVIGGGTGGLGEERALAYMLESPAWAAYDGRAVIVRHRPTGGGSPG